MKARTTADAVDASGRRASVPSQARECERLRRDLEQRDRELADAREQQRAMGEILGEISRSPAALQPVFEALARRACLLCRAHGARVWLAEGAQLRAMTSYGPGYPQGLLETLPLRPTSVGGRAFLERRCVHVEDIAPLLDTEYPDMQELQARNGFRTVLAVPMLHAAETIGLISLLRNEVRPFAASEIGLVQTFADQAVIAIQNARLFNEIHEALEHQTATSDVLQVISSSIADATPVFDKILDSCRRLFSATDTGVFLVEGDDRLNAAAWRGEFAAVVPGNYPRPLAGTMSDTVIRHGALRHWPDVAAAADVPGYIAGVAREHGNFSVALAPLMWEGRGIGTLDVMRKPPRAFGDKELALLRSFADQAVIAIQNARLFNETRRALEHQTATAEVLKVISQSPTDVQPVFDAICDRAMALCGANIGGVARFDGEWVHLVAFRGISPHADAAMRAAFPMRPSRASITARAVLEGRPVEIADVEKDADYQLKAETRLAGFRSNLAVPMLRDGKAIGSIAVCRPELGSFPRHLIELLQTFADQAVIAIENVRLFNEREARNRDLAEALDQQAATAEILGVISRSPTDVQPVFDAIARRSLALCGGKICTVARFDGELIHVGAFYGSTPDAMRMINALYPMRPGSRSVISRTVRDAVPVQIPNAEADLEYGSREGAARAGYRSLLGVPMIREGQVIGAIGVARAEVGRFPDKQVELLRTFADQAVIAIENVRLFSELREKGEQLALASRHKSQFLANMSHELRTPLNAIIGFTRIVMRRTQGQIEPKQAENLEKILASGHHLLALINAVLDLSKIEAGRVEVIAAEVDPAPVLRQCVLTIEPLVRLDAVRLEVDLDDALPTMWVDEEKLRQIVINLLGNAAKFTAGGTIRLGASGPGNRDGEGERDADGAERIRITVSDTGIGIPADKLGLIFEEFEQADTSSTRLHDGTGLGLAIARRLARLMGGDIEAHSVPGQGSTFTLTLPLRYRAPVHAEVPA